MSSNHPRNAQAEQMTVRTAGRADRGWLYELHEQAHRSLVERAYGPWHDEQQQGFFQALVDENEVYILERDQQPVGAVYLVDRDQDVWLELVEVLPSYQGQGLGTGALRWVLGRAAVEGRTTRLQVHRVNDDARRLYLAEGFVAEGETSTHRLLRHPPLG